MSFGEMVLLGVVAIVVVGPRNLPSLLRTAGQLIGKVRRMANDLRTESGIDEILDAEGIRSEIDNFRRLASGAITPEDLARSTVPDREREYPRVGPDAYGAYSEDLVPYLPAELPSLAAAPDGTVAADAGTNGREVSAAEQLSTAPAQVAPLSGAAPTTASPSTNGASVKS
jgi:sec-independent protein translocase protein TatB